MQEANVTIVADCNNTRLRVPIKREQEQRKNTYSFIKTDNVKVFTKHRETTAINKEKRDKNKYI